MSIYDGFDGSFISKVKPKHRRKNFYKNNKEKLDRLLKIVYWANDIKEALKCFDDNIQSPPKCHNCGDFPGFTANPSVSLYRKFCKKEECQKVRNLQSHTPEAKEKYTKTCLDRHGYENPFKSQEWQSKNKEKFYEKYGVYNCMHLDETKQKAKTTCIERYRVDNPWKNDEIKNKRKDTWIEKYGVDNPSKSPEVINKAKDTFYSKYGGYPLSLKEFRDKGKQTFLDKWGVDHYMKCDEGIAHWRLKFAEKYDGIDHPMHVSNIASKQASNSGGFKEYTSSNGNIYRIQGYEHFAIEILEKIGVEFLNERHDIGNISYIREGVDRKYYPDIFVPEYNLYLEVKSRYTYENDITKIECIKKSNPEMNFIVIIFNNDGSIDEIV